MPRQYWKDALIIFFVLAFVYAYFYQDSGWNGNSRFGLIYAVVQEGRLTIDSYHTRFDTQTEDKAFANGHYYSDKAIGQAVAGVIAYEPLYWIKRLTNRISMAYLEQILTFLVIGLPSAFAGSLMYILCLYMSKSRFRAFLVTMTVTLGTLYLPYSVIFFSHQFASSLLFSAFFMIFFLKEQPRLWKNWYLFVLGLLLGWALISEYPTATIILALLVYYFSIIWRNQTYRNLRSIGWPLLGGAIPVLLQVLYNKLCFGNFLSIGYANLENSYFSSSMGQGLMGIHWPNLSVLYYMTFHTTIGVFWETPALFLAFFGAGFMFYKRRYREEAVLAIWIIVSYFVMMSGYYMWWGGWALGPRHIIPVLPFFCILLTFVPRRLTWPLVILSLISIGQMLIGAASVVLVSDWMVPEIPKLGFFQFTYIGYCLQELIKGHFGPNLGQSLLDLNSWYSLIPLLVVMVVATGFFFWKHNGIIPAMKTEAETLS